MSATSYFLYLNRFAQRKWENRYLMDKIVEISNILDLENTQTIGNSILFLYPSQSDMRNLLLEFRPLREAAIKVKFFLEAWPLRPYPPPPPPLA